MRLAPARAREPSSSRSALSTKKDASLANVGLGRLLPLHGPTRLSRKPLNILATRDPRIRSLNREVAVGSRKDQEATTPRSVVLDEEEPPLLSA